MWRKWLIAAAITLTGVAQDATGAENQISATGLGKPNDPGLPAVIARIAGEAIALDRGTESEQRLDDLFHLELAAGEYTQSIAIITSLDRLRAQRPPVGSSAFLNVRWRIYAEAKRAAASATRFEAEFSRRTTHALARLSDKDAYALLYSMGTPLPYLQSRWEAALKEDRGKQQLSLAYAIALVRAYVAFTAYREFQPLAWRIGDADDARRYVVIKALQVPTDDGASVCVLVVRPRRATRLPTLFDFSIYYDPVVKLDDARRNAANCFAAVMGFTRGKACSPGLPVPMLHDGADADAVIDWIARQPWSDGRVGMFGGSYDAFTQWAVTKHSPAALKGIMPSVSYSPGTDFPMDGGVFMTYGFPWPFYTTDNKTLDDRVYYDSARWDRLERDWYVSGSPYRDLDKIAGSPNPVWESWLAHPEFDSFWRDLKPSDDELARLSIPVLTTTGYYDSGQSGALSYFSRLARANPTAENYLVIGPWDHHTGQLGTISPLGNPISEALRGYTLDPVAQFDVIELRYQWFNWIFGRGPKPAILKDRINYEAMGANAWKHAPDLAAMGPRRQRFYLNAAPTPQGYALAQRPDNATAARQSIDFRDRSDVNRLEPFGPLIDQALDDWPIVTTDLDIANSIAFATAPLARATEISGLFSGTLDIISNKKDFDFAVTLFELTANGKWMQLSYDWQRASLMANPGVRHLLTPGKRARLAFSARRLTSRLFARGSRLVVVLNVVKQPGEEIDYGSGKTVPDETIADAGAPLTLVWWSDSYIDIPTAR